MHLEPLQYVLGSFSGVLVGFTLGLFGGGGSILAVPLVVYLVGVPSVHLAVGTSAVAVAVNAATNLVSHARRGNINWPCALIYSSAGVVGALIGSSVGKNIDGQKLLFLFALLMVGVGILMLRTKDFGPTGSASCTLRSSPKTICFGSGTGALAGFFGIGGGFLIVPGLMASTGMPMLTAIGSLLVAVAALGATTALNYAFSGMVDWLLAACFVAGGTLGGIAGAAAATSMSARRGLLKNAFSIIIFVVAAYVAYRALNVA